MTIEAPITIYGSGSRDQEYVLHPLVDVKDGEHGCLSVEEQILNVQNGHCLLELRDAFQGIPHLVYPEATHILPVLTAAQIAGVHEATITIHTKCGSVVDQTSKDLLLLMREYSNIQPSIAIPSTPDGAATAKDLITNYHRGLQVKVFISAAEERMAVHGWDIEGVMAKSQQTIESLTKEFPNPVVSVIEQASQASDDNLFKMVEMSAQAGASGVCIADSLSFFGEEEAFDCILKIRNYINSRATELELAGQFEDADRFRRLRLEFHGHNDFGKASEAALGAMRAGAVVHVTPGSPAGIGERAGNASLKDTYAKANDFLESLGFKRVKPERAVDILDRTFMSITNVSSADYGPGGKNADITCAALHADYILKIWKKLKAARNQLSESDTQVNRDEVAQLEYLYKTGYLPRHEGQSVGKHGFSLNPFSNEDTVRMYYHQLTGKDPDAISQETIEYILWVIKDRNRPLTPMEVKQMLETETEEVYPWQYIAEMNSNYAVPSKGTR